jgi:hypothetical protein
LSKEADSKKFSPSVLLYVYFFYVAAYFSITPLGLQVKILYAGWRRDGTWPDNATVVDEDNFFGTIGPEINK